MPGIVIQTNVKDVSKRLAKLPSRIVKVGTRTIFGAVVEITRIMSRPAIKPTYPINWDSERQKKAFFATGGFKTETPYVRQSNRGTPGGLYYRKSGGGIPYKRTGERAGGWTYNTILDGYIIENVGHKVGYLVGAAATGEGQSRIHAGRWPKIQAVLERVASRLPEKLRAALDKWDEP